MQTNKGFIKWIIIIVIALIALGYYGFDVRKAIDTPTTQKNLNYAKDIALDIWNSYLKESAIYIWKHVFDTSTSTPSH